MGTCPALQATAAAVPPVQDDPEGQGKHPVTPTRYSPGLQDVGIKQDVAGLFAYSPGAQATGAAKPPAHVLRAVQLVQKGALLAGDGLI